MIAHLISETFATTAIRNRCESACFLLYVAGAKRALPRDPDNLPRLGIHNVYLGGANAKSLTLTELVRRTSDANKRMQALMAKYEVPAAIIDKSIRRTSQEMHYISAQEFVDIGLFKPSVEQSLVTKCNYSAAEMREFVSRMLGLPAEPAPLVTSKEFGDAKACIDRWMSVASLDGVLSILSAARPPGER